ncbi:MAG: Abi-alpha family protein [Acidobacteria bacterium]|nr:Abi-alpha family protein [Acidobacteriota bacterium]
MDPVTGAVIIAGLTTAGKPTAEMLTSIISKIISPAAGAVGQGIAAPLKAWAKRRGERAGATLIEAADLLRQAQIEPQPVPGRLLLPILEHTSLEEDEDLQHQWAALLANAATPDNKVLPAFAEILHQLTPVQAKVLQWMYEMRTFPVPNWIPHWPDVERQDIEAHFNLSRADYALFINDMDRMQLIEGRRHLSTPEGASLQDVVTLAVDRWNSRVKYELINFTPLGINFMQACTPPEKAG